jgi:hypothetical protein
MMPIDQKVNEKGENMQNYRITLFAIFASAILLVSLASPHNVLAQDDIPPTDIPAVTDQPPVTDEPLITNEPAVTEEPVGTQESVTTDAPAEPAQEQTSVSEILDQIPEGTDVIVLNEDGQPEPLVTQAAADIIVSGDPMWCPVGVLPGGVGCTASFASFTDLIAELENLTGSDVGAGTIYIDANYSATGLNPDAGSDIIFDYGAIGLTDLVFQGGWDFGSNTVVGTSNLTGIDSLQFLDWGAASLTLQDILILGGSGLYIGNSDINNPLTTANVTLENVHMAGPDSLGTFIETNGSVVVMDSSFVQSTVDGLEISSGGNITFTNVNSSQNNGNGVTLDNSSGTGNVTITNGIFGSDRNYGGNTGIGLDVVSNGNITLNNIAVYSNYGVGAVLLNCGCLSAGDINVFNSAFINNDDMGLIALSGGNVTLFDIDALGNDNGGIIVQNGGNLALNDVNSGYNGDIGVGIITDGNVTLTNSVFFDNAGPGAYLTSSGSVIVNNSFFGNCYLDPSMCEDQPVGLIVESLGVINIFNSQFNQNTDTGLILMSDNNVFLNNVTADGNYVGAVVLTSGNVKVCGGSYSDNDRFGFTATAGTVFMSEQTLISGNGDAPTDLGPGTELLTYDCTPKTAKVRHSQNMKIDCGAGLIGIELRLPNRDSLIGVELYLPNGDSLIVPCPMGGPASLSSVAFNELPDDLLDGFNFVSGLDAQAARDDLTISFVKPLPDVSYIILHWDGTAWVELEGITTIDGTFAVAPVEPGIYVLATK